MIKVKDCANNLPKSKGEYFSNVLLILQGVKNQDNFQRL